MHIIYIYTYYVYIHMLHTYRYTPEDDKNFENLRTLLTNELLLERSVSVAEAGGQSQWSGGGAGGDDDEGHCDVGWQDEAEHVLPLYIISLLSIVPQ